MQRIHIVGQRGAGKTTFGKALAARLEHPAIDLDDLRAKGGNRRSFESDIAQAAASARWVIIGDNQGVSSLVWPKADVVIWLDYPFPLVFYRLVKRILSAIIFQTPGAGGHIPKLGRAFSRKGNVYYVLKNFRRDREKLALAFASAPAGGACRFLRFTSPAQAAAFFGASTQATAASCVSAAA